MIVVPLGGDTIQTTDGQKLRVISYTNYRDGGPAVYCRNRGDKTQTLVYFFDIVSINGTKVEYSRGSKMFNALGKITRTQHLPQPDDNIVVATKNEKISAEVDSLKLKSKLYGENKGIVVKDKDGAAHRLKSILDIDSDLGGIRFNRRAFLSTYEEYLGV
jgi:hypothetical protein